MFATKRRAPPMRLRERSEVRGISPATRRQVMRPRTPLRFRLVDTPAHISMPATIH